MNQAIAKKMLPFVGAPWVTPLVKAFDKFYKHVIPKLKEELEAGTKVFPSQPSIFRAFKETPYELVRVVILGLDPYHNAGAATGLAFDNPKNQKPSPSLRNILKEIESDTGSPSLAETNSVSYLEHLPPQGVLLLNTALTVREGEPTSHLDIWKDFTEEVIESLNQKQDLIWVLWGKKAAAFKSKISPNHTIIETAHPSPFSNHLFKGCKCFSKVNLHLNGEKIIW